MKYIPFESANKFRPAKRKRGFTLIEVLLVIAIVLVVGFFSAAFPIDFMSRMSVRDAQSGISAVLRKAQMYALSGREKSAWGAHYDSGTATVVLFSGSSYSNRNNDLDEIIEINENIFVSDFDDVIFQSPGGVPDGARTITLSRDTETAHVSLNAEGALE